jgi:4-hydroxy-3-methylbut-2-enyl diphosphate reductase
LIVVAAPLALEARALRRGAPGLRVLRTGMGPARARRAAERLRADPAGAVAVAGLCGALVPELVPGDVVVASAVEAERGDAIPLETDAIVRALRESGIEPRVGRVVCTDHLAHGRERERLARCGALAVDMESAWLAPGAGVRPLAVVRVVIDGPRHELWRPAAARQLLLGLRRLRALAPAIERWADGLVAQRPLQGSMEG